MAQFAVFLYSPAPADPMDITPEELAAHDNFAKVVAKHGGEILTPQALQPSTTSHAVRGGKVTKGTFLESEAVLAGYMVLEAKDEKTALEIAKAVPTKGSGGVEVRPIFTPPSE